MRRLISLVAVVLVMAAIVLAGVVPAFAVKPSQPPQPPSESQFHPGQYVCFFEDPETGEFIVEENVPRGQTALFEEQGYFCFSQQF